MMQVSRRLAAPSIWLFALLWVAGCGRVPQMAASPEAMHASDALWTAITAQDKALLAQSITKIESLHRQGQLPEDAFEALRSIAATAESGNWDNARKSLKKLIQGQRAAES